jgi:hypothetical protein
MKRILLASSLLLLFSCKKDPQASTCQCYEKEYHQEIGTDYDFYWEYNNDGLPFTDFCANDGKEREVGNRKYIQVCN